MKRGFSILVAACWFVGTSAGIWLLANAPARSGPTFTAQSGTPQVLGAGTGTGTTCTAGSSNAKGTYATLGTLSQPVGAITVGLLPGTSARRFKIDIAINTGGADSIIVANAYTESGGSGGNFFSSYYFPVALPSGAIVKFRCSCTTNSGVATALVTAYPSTGGRFKGRSKVVSLTDFTNGDPTNTVTLNGTTQTAWAAIAASTSARVSRLWLVPATGGDVSRTSAAILVDIGTGGSGSEVTKAQFLVSQNTLATVPVPNVLDMDIPASTRLSFRAQAASATADTFGMVALGLAD